MVHIGYHARAPNLGKENANEVCTNPREGLNNRTTTKKARRKRRTEQPKMASSQVEMASSSPFGCVLRDRNRRDGCRESTGFQRNIKNFVMDHLNTCISTISSDSATNENKEQNQMNNAAASWVSKPANSNNLARLRFKRNNHSNINNSNDNNESSLASLISPRHSRLLDRWAAKQARQMVSTLESEEAELLAIDNNSNNNNSILKRTSSSNSDEFSSEFAKTKLGASSLVQIWEKRLNKSSVSKPNTPIERSSSNSATSSIEITFSVAEQSRVLETGETGECCELPSGNEEPFPDWEPDKTGQSSDQSVSPPRGRWSSSESSDRVSVANIIKRLQTQNDDSDHEGCGGTSSVADSPSAAENSEQRVFPQVTCTPRVRGRKAFDDLLMKLEQDRHGELKNLSERGAVSKFTQRGRIQASLRLRLLQRGVVVNEPYRLKSTASEVNRQPAQGSSIMQLREKFSNGAEQRKTVQAEVASPKSPHKEIANNTTQLDNSSSVDQINKEKSSKTSHGTANQSTESTQKSVSKTSEDHKRQEDHPSSDITLQETRFEARHDVKQETAEATTSRPDSIPDERTDKAETSNQQHAMSKSSYEETVDEVEANHKRQEAHPSSDITLQETRFEARHDVKQETAEATTSRPDSIPDERTDKAETSNQQHAMSKSSYEETVDEVEANHKRQEAHPSSDITLQETRFEARHDVKQETAEATTSRPDSIPVERTDKSETSNQQHAMSKRSYEETVDEVETSNQKHAETSHDNAVEEEDYAESSYEELVEELVIDQDYCETNYDWISEISRPKSYWEERRQAWYREMLDSGSQKEDIRKLLERRTVSTFLTSDFRETMDRLMQSHRGTQTHLISSEDDEEDNQGLIAFLKERMHSASPSQEEGRERGGDEEEERMEEEVEEEEEKEDEDEHEHEVGVYSNPSLAWSFRDHEASDDFDRVASTSSQPYQAQSYGDSRRNSSSSHHNSIEMELIYDMRSNMEQLYREMAELRKSIQSCMDMQMQLQQSMNQEVLTVKKEERKFHNRAPKKGNCCICYDMKVDSVLYRCGHMCTCLKCANELQWNSGKCPICRAKIVDVVRVYVDV